jgi:hypothetical protein
LICRKKNKENFDTVVQYHSVIIVGSVCNVRYSEDHLIVS